MCSNLEVLEHFCWLSLHRTWNSFSEHPNLSALRLKAEYAGLKRSEEESGLTRNANASELLIKLPVKRACLINLKIGNASRIVCQPICLALHWRVSSELHHRHWPTISRLSPNAFGKCMWTQFVGHEGAKAPAERAFNQLKRRLIMWSWCKFNMRIHKLPFSWMHYSEGKIVAV